MKEARSRQGTHPISIPHTRYAIVHWCGVHVVNASSRLHPSDKNHYSTWLSTAWFCTFNFPPHSLPFNLTTPHDRPLSLISVIHRATRPGNVAAVSQWFTVQFLWLTYLPFQCQVAVRVCSFDPSSRFTCQLTRSLAHMSAGTLF